MVREALFNIIGESIRGARVLDLFTGAGTLGFEALSRGAASAMLVDSDRTCVTIVAENLALTGFAQHGDVVCAEATHWLRAHQNDLSTFNLVMLDPPYQDSAALGEALTALDQSPLRPQAMVVVEHHRGQPLPPLKQLSLVRERDYGATRLTFLRFP